MARPPSLQRRSRFAIAIAAAGLFAAAPLGAQSDGPQLSRDQRASLQSLIAAVDSGPVPETAPRDWPVHVLRASDGSHYVAFTLSAPSLPAEAPILLYVRLSRRQDERLAGRERSLIAEWLAGERNAPPPPPRRGIALGEMPAFGAGAAGQRTQTVVAQNAALLDLERERARAQREARDRERKAALEGETPRSPTTILPFEDFDLSAQASRTADGRVILQRSLTTGPGDYDLSVAWMPARAEAGTVSVVRRRLALPTASTTEFALSSIILADAIGSRAEPLTPEQQAGRPYAIGTMEITPARDSVLTSVERLAFILQVVNPRPGADGKPEVTVNFRVTRTTPGGQQHVGDLAPQTYDRTTLPVNFDIARGHPLFAAVEVPLDTFRRGDYRLQALAEDHLAGVSASAEAAFSVIATPATLLREAPALSAPFRRSMILTPGLRDAIASGLSPKVPSAALAAALEATREGRFVDLLRIDGTAPGEEAAAAMLRALGLYALGDTPRVIAAALQRSPQPDTPAGRLLGGALRALEGSDADAVAAWTQAIQAGLTASLLAPALMDAHMRQGQAERALAIASGDGAADADGAVVRRVAAAHLAMGRRASALEVLDRRLHAASDDLEAQWLRLHALFAEAATADGAGADNARRRFRELAPPYIAAKGPHADLAAEWLAALP